MYPSNRKYYLPIAIVLLLTGCLRGNEKDKSATESLEIQPMPSGGSTIVSLNCRSIQIEEGHEISCVAVDERKMALNRIPTDHEFEWPPPTSNFIPLEDISCKVAKDNLSQICFVEGDHQDATLEVRLVITNTITGGQIESEGGSTFLGYQLIFVTAEFFSGDLGGYDGADQSCQTAADNAKGIDPRLEGTWKALIGSDLSRLTIGEVRNLDGDFILSISDPGEINPLGILAFENPVRLTESGFRSLEMVWTGGNGRDTCLGWTDRSFQETGSIGSGTLSGTDAWDYSNDNCSGQNSVYCINGQ